MSNSRITVRITPPQPKNHIDRKPDTNKVTTIEQIQSPAMPSRQTSFASPPLRRRRPRSKNQNRFNSIWNHHILLQIVVPVISAVVIGTAFGMATLNLFTDEQWDSKAMIGKASLNMGTTLQSSEEAEQLQGGSTHETAQPISTEKEVTSLQFPGKTIYVVQAGVFENQEGADVLQSSLREQGWPAVLWQKERAHLLLAAGSDRNDVLSLASYFKNNGADIYLKEWELPPLDFTLESEKPENVIKIKQFLDHTMQLWELLSMASARAIESGVAIDDELRESMITLHQTLLSEEKELNSIKFPGERESVTRMIQSLTSAVSKFEQYQKQPHPSYIMGMQEQLLQYADHYQKWLQELQQDSR